MLNRTASTEGLVEVRSFGTNPGGLKAFLHLPPDLPSGAPLVIAMHGCTQSVEDFATGTGWSDLADRHGFAVLYPEQQRENNPHLCFNWFEPVDIRRDQGEVGSVRQMVEHVVAAYGLDPRRIFILGLSAGGAMANALLALYPDTFSAGAIIGGLPFGTATGVSQAFLRMQDQHRPPTSELRRLIRRTSPKAKKWPRISVWQGSHDHTVRPNNADMIVEQWLAPHSVEDRPHSVETIGGHVRSLWIDEAGRPAIEHYRVRSAGHGVPLSRNGQRPVGRIGAFMLDTDISSTMRIAAFFGLVSPDEIRHAEGDLPRKVEKTVRQPRPAKPREPKQRPRASLETRITTIINDALRAAGRIR